MKNDEFGDRMKGYEQVETSRKLDTSKPIYARIDGRAFHTFTRDMKKPCDLNLFNAMIETTKYLVGETHACIGYVQSDEISLVWKSGAIFEGKVQKMCSVLASMAAARFGTCFTSFIQQRYPHFDARVINLPSEDEAANMVLWRAMDAKKNAILGVARYYLSYKQMQNKGQAELLEMISEAGGDMNNFPIEFRYGAYIRRINVTEMPSAEFLAKIPEPFRPTGPITRSYCRVIDMPPFNKVKNRVGVIFNSEDPEVENEYQEQKA